MKIELYRFLRYLQIEKGASEGTIDAYQLDIERGLIPFLRERGKFEVGEITKADIQDYMDYVATSRGNSNVTRARKLAAIKSFFNYLAENDKLEVNPAVSIRSPKLPQKEPEYLAEEECICLLKTIARKSKPRVRERDMAMTILFLHTGLRVSELTNLELVNVDLARNQIKITRKGNREQYIHLNTETAKALANYLDNRPQTQNGKCFVGTAGSNLTRCYVYSLVRKYLKLAGIEKGKRGPHILRHTFCTRLHQKGVDAFTIKELAGHKDINTTMRYIRIENKEKTEAIDRLEFSLPNLTEPLSTGMMTSSHLQQNSHD